jgi:hypothetical protein
MLCHQRGREAKTFDEIISTEIEARKAGTPYADFARCECGVNTTLGNSLTAIA